MTKFSEYRTRTKSNPQPIQEALPDNLAHIPAGYDHHSGVSPQYASDMSNFFGAASHRVFPMLPTGSDSHDADVIDHLVKHGYTPNYVAGTAAKTKIVNHPTLGPIQKDVSEKIGSILEKTGATDTIKQAYTNDPSRSGLKLARNSDKPQVLVLGNSARHIASMTSGFKPSDQGGHGIPSSCMRLAGTTGPEDAGGINQNYVGQDSRHGSIVAFKCDHDDPGLLKNGEPDNPSSRILWKAHHATLPSGEKHTVPRPEDNTYGAEDDTFKRTSDNIARTYFPAAVGVTYNKESALYHDIGSRAFRVTSAEDVKKAIDNGTPIVGGGGGLEHDTINTALSHGRKLLENPESSSQTKEAFIQHASEIGNLGTHHVAILHRLARDNRIPTTHIAANHGDKLSTVALNHEIENGNVSDKMLMNPKLPASAIDNVSVNKYHLVRRSSLKPEHYDKFVHAYINSGIHQYGIENHIPYMSKNNIDDLSKIPLTHNGVNNPVKRPESIVNSPHFTQEHHDALLSALMRGGHKNFLENSKFTTFADTQTGHISNMDNGMSLFNNPHATDVELQKGKNAYMKGVAAGPFFMNRIPGFGGNSIVPEKMSNMFTPHDYETMARNGSPVDFSNAGHSAKLLDAHQKIVKDMDAATDRNDATSMDALTQHVHNYGKQIEHHMGWHAQEGGLISSKTHHDIVGKHLSELSSLKNYESPDRQDFRDTLADQHKELADNTERHDQQMNWQ